MKNVYKINDEKKRLESPCRCIYSCITKGRECDWNIVDGRGSTLTAFDASARDRKISRNMCRRCVSFWCLLKSLFSQTGLRLIAEVGETDLDVGMERDVLFIFHKTHDTNDIVGRNRAVEEA